MTRLSDGSRIEDWNRRTQPPEPEPYVPSETEVLAQRMERALAEFSTVVSQIQVASPAVTVQAPELDLSGIVQAVTELKPGATAEDIAEALAARLAPPQPPDLSALADLKSVLEKMESRLHGIGNQAFGSSGPSNIADNETRKLGVVKSITDTVTVAGTVSVTEPVSVDDNGGSLTVDGTFWQETQPVSAASLPLPSGAATQTTLAAILAALSRTHKVAEGSASLTSIGGFQTVVAVTPSVATVITGFNADVSALTDVSYRLQLTVGGTVKVSETITANRNSWIPVRLSVAASTAIAVQVGHSEVADQTFRASINYEES